MAKKEQDTTLYTIENAINKVKSKKAKFDATIEVHINLAIDAKKQDQPVRYTTTLPHGTGKTKKVAVLASKKVENADLELLESDLDKILKGDIRPKVDFDVLVAEPKFMPKIAKVAKILGPVGAMPNPKTGTVTDDVENAVNQIKKGKIEVRTEKDIPVIHTVIGKLSFSQQQLLENFNELMSSLKQNRPQKNKQDWLKSVYICSTMGKSVGVELTSLL
jgi:large subunit ribosomal protein L1